MADGDRAVTKFAETHRVRISIISLKRNKERWNQAIDTLEAIKRSNIGAALLLDCRVHEGVDGHAHRGLLKNENKLDKTQQDIDQTIKDVENAVSARVYRGWPICEDEDVVRVAGQDEKNKIRGIAWIHYETEWFKGWRPQHRQSYVDYFNRHLTLGESGLAHLEVAEACYSDGIDVQIIFEDDSIPEPHLLNTLFKEIQALEHALKSENKTWDLIFLRSALFDIREETRVHGTSLLYAGHRKCVDAYVLSFSGARKIAQSGFRNELFPYDDFIPALFSHHPRPDVRRLNCVNKVREEGFLAFTFPDMAPLSKLGPASKSSDNNKSPCLLGDHGVETL